MESDGNVNLSNWSIDYSCGRSSPDHGGYYDYIAYVVYPDGDVSYDVNFDWNAKNSYGRKYSVTLRLPTQLETVYCILKLMAEVI